MSKLYIVVPCYNEEEVLRETAARLLSKLSRMAEAGSIDNDYKIAFTDDGSKDSTWSIIEELSREGEHVMGIKLSRNRGHQNALLCGLMTVKGLCDVTISMDADLQDDIEVLDDFMEKYAEGCEIVYGVRKNRDTDTSFKRGSAQSYYKVLGAFGVEIVYNHADYRLMSAKALNALESFGEVNLFLRGIVPMLGFKTDTVEYDRGERFAGESKYPMKKMAELALNGITSFSVKPIRMILAVGIVIFLISLVLLIISLAKASVSGTMIMSVWLVGSLQLIAIGIVGEYVGKAYMETKRRPKYIVEKIVG